MSRQPTLGAKFTRGKLGRWECFRFRVVLMKAIA